MTGPIIPSEPVIAVIIGVLLYVAGRAVIARVAVAERDPWLAKALNWCLILHLVCASLQIWVVDHLYDGVADYNKYDSQGAILSRGFRHFDFSLAPAHLQGIVSNGAVSIVAGVVFAIVGVNQLAGLLRLQLAGLHRGRLLLPGVHPHVRGGWTPSVRFARLLPSDAGLLDLGREQGGHHDLPTRSRRLRMCADSAPSQWGVPAGHRVLRPQECSSVPTRCCCCSVGSPLRCWCDLLGRTPGSKVLDERWHSSRWALWWRPPSS